jgi:signal transduction histidine kinase
MTAAGSGHGTIWRSTGLRWGAGFAVILGCSLLLMFGLMFWRSSTLLFDTLDRSVTEQLELLAARPPDMLAFMIASRMNHGPEIVTRVGLFDAARTSIVGDVDGIPPGLALDGTVQAVIAPDGIEHWRAAGRRLLDERLLVVARAADEFLDVRADLVRGAAVGIIPAILLSLGGGMIFGYASERRLRRLNAVAERIIGGDLQERLPEHAGGGELDRLCIIVNRMLERLQEVVSALKGTGDNIAHDLRTPLTSLRARLERTMALAGADTAVAVSLGQSIQNVDQALSIITALLRISEIRHTRRQSKFGAFALADVLRETAESYQAVAEEKGVALEWAAERHETIVGDRQLVVEALVNLVDNAVKFTPCGGQVRIVLGGSPGQPVVVVADSGPGIGPDQRATVFKRFHRGDSSRTTPGSGLGLSLVAEIMRLHDFSVVIADNRPGCLVELLCWPGSAATVESARDAAAA